VLRGLNVWALNQPSFFPPAKLFPPLSGNPQSSSLGSTVTAWLAVLAVPSSVTSALFRWQRFAGRSKSKTPRLSDESSYSCKTIRLTQDNEILSRTYGISRSLDFQCRSRAGVLAPLLFHLAVGKFRFLEERMIGFRFPVGAGKFSLRHHVQTGSRAHSASYPMGIGSSFPGG
jgi:hypothetical protein